MKNVAFSSWFQVGRQAEYHHHRQYQLHQVERMGMELGMGPGSSHIAYGGYGIAVLSTWNRTFSYALQSRVAIADRGELWSFELDRAKCAKICANSRTAREASCGLNLAQTRPEPTWPDQAA